MPKFRITVSDGKAESSIIETFPDRARIDEIMARRGWAKVVAVEEVVEIPGTAPDPGESSPIEVELEQVVSKGGWMHLAPEIAKRHPLYGVGGWAGVLLAYLGISFIGGAYFTWVEFDLALRRDAHPIVIGFLTVSLIIVLWFGVAVVQLLSERSSFRVSFTVLMGVAAFFQIVLFTLTLTARPVQVVGILIALTLVIYVWTSRRIEVTCRKRVSTGDPFLSRLVPRAPVRQRG